MQDEARKEKSDRVSCRMAGTTGCDRGIADRSDRSRAARCRREQGCSERADARQEARTAGRLKKSSAERERSRDRSFFQQRESAHKFSIHSGVASVCFWPGRRFILSPKSDAARTAKRATRRTARKSKQQRHEKEYQTPHRGRHRSLRAVCSDNRRRLCDHLPFYRAESGDTLAAAVRPDI